MRRQMVANGNDRQWMSEGCHNIWTKITIGTVTPATPANNRQQQQQQKGPRRQCDACVCVCVNALNSAMGLTKHFIICAD